MLVTGRVGHAIGMFSPPPNLPRVAGMLLTWSGLALSAATLALTLLR